jgi:energy-converting hydrogenase Eha subunit G
VILRPCLADTGQLRAMIARFVGFMGLTSTWRTTGQRYDADDAVVAFSGICFCLWTLGRATWTVKQIVWLML